MEIVDLVQTWRDETGVKIIPAQGTSVTDAMGRFIEMYNEQIVVPAITKIIVKTTLESIEKELT